MTIEELTAMAKVKRWDFPSSRHRRQCSERFTPLLASPGVLQTSGHWDSEYTSLYLCLRDDFEDLPGIIMNPTILDA